MHSLSRVPSDSTYYSVIIPDVNRVIEPSIFMMHGEQKMNDVESLLLPEQQTLPGFKQKPSKLTSFSNAQIMLLKEAWLKDFCAREQYIA